MKSEEWKTYRTRFLVNAKQLSSALSFVDHLGRQHRGRKGDYLVESSDGVISIAPRHIFEDIYVHMPSASEPDIDVSKFAHSSLDRLNVEALEIERVNFPKPPARTGANRGDGTDQRRKLPQPDRRSSVERMRLM
ncbi:MAG TPA: hypothetical protein VH350_12935 [Candidatus Sulfotelmatobacter sp.]|jgi:hypothetical protein|nr:hypothetical protein [Candidatus Sulfotelmatobacter sp.]